MPKRPGQNTPRNDLILSMLFTGLQFPDLEGCSVVVHVAIAGDEIAVGRQGANRQVICECWVPAHRHLNLRNYYFETALRQLGNDAARAKRVTNGFASMA